MALCFVTICLAPGGVPRYTLPLLVPASILLAIILVCRSNGVPAIVPVLWSRTVGPVLVIATLAAIPSAVAGGAEVWRLAISVGVLMLGTFLFAEHCRFRRWGGVPVLALSSAAAMGLITADFSLGAVPHIRRTENVRPLAQKVNRIITPTGESVTVLAPGFLPFLYYLRPDPIYVQNFGQVSPGSHFLLLRESDLAGILKPLKEVGHPPQTLRRLDDKNRGHWYLLRLDATPSASL